MTELVTLLTKKKEETQAVIKLLVTFQAITTVFFAFHLLRLIKFIINCIYKKKIIIVILHMKLC